MAYLNYNVALLKTIREPLLEGLTPVKEALQAVVAGTLSVDQVQAKGAIESAGNLQMVGRPSLVLSLRALATAVGRLAEQSKDWPLDKTVEVARTGAGLIDQVIYQIRAAERGQPAGQRDLMRAWTALAKAADLPIPTPADLFDGDADIDASRFSAMDAQILRETAMPHVEKFTNALNVLRAPVQENQWSGVLSDMEEVFDWACAVRHRLGFHAYWCAARARIAWESLSGFPSGDRDGAARLAAFTRAMQQASLELRKFSEDARRTRPDSIMELMRPLLLRWPEDWTSRRQALSDVVALFNLEEFWRQTEEGSRPAETSDALVPDVTALARQLHGLKNAWMGQSGVSKPDFTVIGRGLGTFLPPYGMHVKAHGQLGGAGAQLIETLNQLSEHIAAGRAVPQPAFFEVATLLLVVEDTLGLQDGTDLEALSTRVALINRRVTAALTGDGVLRSLPRPVWSRRRLSRMASSAVAIAVSEVKADLSFIVDVVDEFFMSDAAAARPQYDNIRKKVLMDAQVLRTLGQPTAAAIMDEVYKDLVILTHPGAPKQEAKEFHRLTQALAGLQAFLDSFASGDHDAGRLLDPALAALNLTHSLDKSLSEFVPAFQAHDQKGDEVQSVAEPQGVADELVEENTPSVETLDTEPTIDSISADIQSTPVLAEVVSGPVEAGEPQQEGPTQEEIEDQQARVAEAFSQGQPWTDHVDDRELVEAFVEETLSVFERLEAARIACIEEPTNLESLIDLRRQFHTLKGSGRMSGLWGIGEYAAYVEIRLNEARDNEERYTDPLDRVVEVAAGRLSEFLGELSREGSVRIGQLHQRELFGTIEASYPQLPSEEDEAAHLAAEQAERLAAEQAEAERLAAEHAEAERLAAEHAEAERLAAEQAEVERLAAEQAEVERLAAEQAEAERLAAEQAEAERLAAEQADSERLAAERAEAERLAAEQAEAERLAAEQSEAERLAAEQAEVERLADEARQAAEAAAQQLEDEEQALAIEHAQVEDVFEVERQGGEGESASEQTQEQRDIARAEDEDFGMEPSEPVDVVASDLEVLAPATMHDFPELDDVEQTSSVMESTSSSQEGLVQESLDTAIDDDAALEDIIMDLRTHRDNMRRLMAGGQEFDAAMLNWSVHTLASLARGLGHERFRAFCKTLERKIEGDVDAQQSGNPMDPARAATLMSLSAVVLEKTEALLLAPRAPLDWDALDESAERTLADMEEGSPFGAEERDEAKTAEDKLWDEVSSRMSSIVDHFGALQALFHELSKLRK